MNLEGRVALVTGAGRRVGRAIAVALARQGMHLAVHYNASAAEAAETAAEVDGAGPSAATFCADLSETSQIGPLVAAVVSRFGALDVVVNSAAVMRKVPFADVTAVEWDMTMALNLRSPFFVSQAAAPHLARAGGAIINIADLAAFEVWPDYLPHAVSKAGVVHMTRALARVLAPHVRVNAVAPGPVLLPDDWRAAEADHLAQTTPLKRLGRPEDVAAAVIYLASADYVTGETLIVDGGRHVRC
ncbi:MAG: pteridine reductase [Gemmatimonadaceae bacterium]